MTAAGKPSRGTRTAVRVGVDVGGTFTDVVFLKNDGTVLVRKILSSPPDFNRAIMEGMRVLLSENGLAGADVQEFTHGATVATNCILTRTGAVTGLLTTTGFRDVLEIRRMRMHKLYDVGWEKPPPLVPRHLRREVDGRTDPHSGVVEALDEVAVREAVALFRRNGVESVAVCYLHAYVDGANERRTREIINACDASLSVSLSCEVLPEIKEYERTSTTVINAYVRPAVARYVCALEGDLKNLGITAPAAIMQSNGGMSPLAEAAEFPVHIVESGPAAGVTGAHLLARRIGLDDAITFDMGGTTAKAAIIENGAVSRSPEYEVGGEVSIGHRMMKGSGYLLRVPSIDLAEVSAGGGSIAWVDRAGALKLGPASAGAVPGPACYARGGKAPTMTDANVCLGLTNPKGLAGGRLTLQPELAERAIADHIAAPLGRTVTDVALAIRAVANAHLVRALRAVSTERGRDPRRFSLIAFGGMGPVHALDVARELGIARVVIPPLPGLFSALGLLFADTEHHLVRTCYLDPDRPDLDRLNALVQAMDKSARATLLREGYDQAHQEVALFADVRYVGQDHTLELPLSAPVSSEAHTALVAAFHDTHERTYGYRSISERVQIVGVRCVARGVSDEPKMPERLRPAPASAPAGGTRRACFGAPHGWIDTPVLPRAKLSGTAKGPLLIEEDNSVTVVPPGWRAEVDDWSNILLESA